MRAVALSGMERSGTRGQSPNLTQSLRISLFAPTVVVDRRRDRQVRRRRGGCREKLTWVGTRRWAVLAKCDEFEWRTRRAPSPAPNQVTALVRWTGEVHRRESSAGTGVAPLRRGREANLPEQRFEVVARGWNAGEDPRPRSAGPTGRPREAGAPRPGVPAAPRSHCHASCVSVANSWRSDGAPPARWICEMRAANSRASTSPEFMLCTPTGAAWCAASPASQTPPLPKLRVRRRSNRPSVDQ